MQVQASTDSPLATTADTIAIGVFEDEGVAHDLPGGKLEALLDDGEGGRAFKRLALTHHDSKRVILVGLGRRDEFDGERARCAAGVVHRRAHECRTGTLCWELPHHVDDAIVEGLVGGTMLADYRFTRYKQAPAGEPALEGLIVSAHHDVGDAVARAVVLAEAQNRARDLGNLAPNELTPTALADYAVALAARARHPGLPGTRRRADPRARDGRVRGGSGGLRRGPAADRADLRAGRRARLRAASGSSARP